MGQRSLWAKPSQEWIPSPRSKEGTPHQLYLTHAKQDNPNEVSEMVDALSKPTARKAELFSGKGRDQKANAASRKATGIHNWADRAGNGDTHAKKRLT
ncbi:hypothetical protein ccbrp13_70740 [Ktedonobacteria bacterium brp13]|nr:hypothetical protein ccbrp13_62430 [Ktedonobacteria bacterium brp13]BCL84609.1 hypothetical protein ccbrp13_70740 [Ktedonobacteria bacterium brp13]